MQVALAVSGKGLKTSNPDPCAWSCSAMSSPNGKEMVLLFLFFFFLDFVLKFFLDVSDGFVSKAVTRIDW